MVLELGDRKSEVLMIRVVGSVVTFVCESMTTDWSPPSLMVPTLSSSGQSLFFLHRQHRPFNKHEQHALFLAFTLFVLIDGEEAG